MGIKPSEVGGFLAGLAIVAVVGTFVTLRVLHHEPERAPESSPVESTITPPAPSVTDLPAKIEEPLQPVREVTVGPDCQQGLRSAAASNALTLTTLAWAPFGRPETGWDTYAPLIGKEIGSDCPPDSPDFALALANWKAEQRLPGGGVFAAADFAKVKVDIQSRRPFVRAAAHGVCPPPAHELATALVSEGYSGKVVQLRPRALEAYRRMAAEARKDDPRIAADPRYLTIFSAFRSPEYDAARCATEHNCDGVARATCSPHRSGLAMDLYVGQAPGFGPDSTAETNRRFMSHSPAYLWLVRNGARFGFAPYPFEPWHWEWTGEAP